MMPKLIRMCLEELHQKSYEGMVVQLYWLPKCQMQTGNDPNNGEDFKG